MRDTFQLMLETPTQPSADPSPDDVEAYYRTFCPQDGPPLEDIREHVIRALRAEQRTPQPTDALSEKAAALDLHLLVTQAADLDLATADMQSIRTFVSSHAARWFDARVGVQCLKAIVAKVDAGVTGPRKRKLFAPEDVCSALREVLVDVTELLTSTAQAGRRFRLSPATEEVPLGKQVEVLASAGIRMGEDSSQESLCYNYTETELAQEPFSRILHDLSEHSDDIVLLALKCVETKDDREIYTGLARSIRALCKSKLPLENIDSHVDFDERKARVSFILDGQHEVLDLDASDAWADMRFFTCLSKHLSTRASKRLYILDPHPPSEEAAFVCLGRHERLRLEAAGASLEAV